MRELCIVCSKKINRGGSKLKANRMENSVTCCSPCSKIYCRNTKKYNEDQDKEVI